MRKKASFEQVPLHEIKKVLEEKKKKEETNELEREIKKKEKLDQLQQLLWEASRANGKGGKA